MNGFMNCWCEFRPKRVSCGLADAGRVHSRRAVLVASLIAALLPGLPIRAATDVSTQTISADTTWGATGSPYRLLGSVTVTGGKKLTLGPDAVVEILGDHAITADGATVAIEKSAIAGGTLAVSDKSSSFVEHRFSRSPHHHNDIRIGCLPVT